MVGVCGHSGRLLRFRRTGKQFGLVQTREIEIEGDLACFRGELESDRGICRCAVIPLVFFLLVRRENVWFCFAVGYTRGIVRQAFVG